MPSWILPLPDYSEDFSPGPAYLAGTSHLPPLPDHFPGTSESASYILPQKRQELGFVPEPSWFLSLWLSPVFGCVL